MKESCLDFVSSMMPLSNKLRFVGVFLPHVEMHTKESESSSGTCDTSDFLSFLFSFSFYKLNFSGRRLNAVSFPKLVSCLISAIKVEEGRRTLLLRCKILILGTLTTARGANRSV